MLAIKLKLIGKSGQHSFRVIVQEKRAKLQGKTVDDLGWFNPHSNQIKLNQERLKHWIGNGAQPTESAQKIIAKAGESSDIYSFEGRKFSKKRKKDRKTAAEIPVSIEGLPPVEEAQKLEAEVAGGGPPETVSETPKEE